MLLICSSLSQWTYLTHVQQKKNNINVQLGVLPRRSFNLHMINIIFRHVYRKHVHVHETHSVQRSFRIFIIMDTAEAALHSHEGYAFFVYIPEKTYKVRSWTLCAGMNNTLDKNSIFSLFINRIYKWWTFTLCRSSRVQ